MKTVYTLIFTAVLLFGNSLNAQDVVAVDDGKGINRITSSDYKNVCINGVKRTEVENTFGNISQMNTLFSTSFDVTYDNTPDNYIKFDSNAKGIYFRFVDNSDVGDHNELEYFQIFNDQSSVSIGTTTFKVGDNISVLGDVNINDQKSVIIFNSSAESSSIVIKFNKLNNTITSITYEVFT